ncbi:hypothetical protein Emed_006091 [Eimeria media]
MENPTSSQLICPDLAPPLKAVHLRQTYSELKALLLPSEDAERLQPSQAGQGPRSDHNEGQQLVPLSLTIPLRLQRASGPASRRYRSKQNIYKSKIDHYFSRDSSGRLLREGNAEATAGSSPPAMRPSPWASPSSRGTEHEALGASTENIRSRRNLSNNEKAKGSHSALFLQRRGRRRAQSSDSQEITSFAGFTMRGRSSPDEGFLPVEIKSLVSRLQHRTYSEKMASWRWDRASVASTAVIHSNSAPEGTNSECDAGLVLLPDYEVGEALRIEALERVRQRAKEERVKQQREEQELLVARQQQKQRSLKLSQQLRRRTLQRIREKCIRQEELRKKELQLEMQRVEQAEAQRQYCARHRKELHQRLLQKQREMKRKIRIHAEESVRHSLDAKARHLAWVVAPIQREKSPAEAYRLRGFQIYSLCLRISLTAR